MGYQSAIPYHDDARSWIPMDIGYAMYPDRMMKGCEKDLAEAIESREIWKLEDRINKGAVSMQKLISRFTKGPGKTDSASKEEYTASLVTIIILFCTSATGIYGSMVSGMSGEHTILFSKSLLDFFTAMIFACSLGMVVSFIAVPQLLIFLAIFFLARVIFPLTNESMIADFKACGGMILLATSFRMIKVKMFPIADMIPAMIIVMPLSYLWSAFILPLL